MNILITPDLRACLADFGLCTVLQEAECTPTESSARFGALRWQAPEVLRYEDSMQLSGIKRLSSDIYSFGCVCYEVPFLKFFFLPEF